MDKDHNGPLVCKFMLVCVILHHAPGEACIRGPKQLTLVVRKEVVTDAAHTEHKTRRRVRKYTPKVVWGHHAIQVQGAARWMRSVASNVIVKLVLVWRAYRCPIAPVVERDKRLDLPF